AEEKGYSLITDIEGKFEVPLSGLTVTDKKLKENPEEVKRVIRALVDGGKFYMTNRAESVALYTDWLKLPKPIAERAYTRSLRFVSPDGLGKESTIKNQLDSVHCRRGAARFCKKRTSYGGKTTCANPPHLFGGFADYIYLAPDVLVTKVRDDLPAEAAVLIGAVMANGFQWAVRRGGLKMGDYILIQGPGQQ